MSSGSRWGFGEPPLEAYSRVTDAERFRPLHTAMVEMILRLEAAFDVERAEGCGLDEELEKRINLARPSVRLSPRDPDAAPISVAFSDFPGLHVRFGRWSTELFPVCGCDACDESAEGEIERITRMIDSVTDRGFREAVQHSLIPFFGSGWLETEFRTSVYSHSSGSILDNSQARRMTGGRRRLELNWRPWARRQGPPGHGDP